MTAVGEASVKDFFESLKECLSLSAIGAQPRMMSWFSFKYQHQVFVARFHAESTKILVLPPSLLRIGCGPMEEPAAMIDGAAAKAHYSEEL